MKSNIKTILHHRLQEMRSQSMVITLKDQTTSVAFRETKALNNYR